MSKICEFCGKGPVAGGSVVRRGMSKKKGGVGEKIVRRTKRVFRPNLQKLKVTLRGVRRTINICTACIKSGKANKK